MNHFVPVRSQHALSSMPPTSLISSTNDNSALTDLCETYGAEPVKLRRTREGRELSRVRYRRAEEFMTFLVPEVPLDWPDFLYSAGIVVQLGLSSHLLDVGFPDDWCARHVGLHVDRSLAYANVTGFGCECAETTRLTQILAPYWKWNRRHLTDGVYPDSGFTADQVRALVRALMDHVCHVTGHRHRPIMKSRQSPSARCAFEGK